MASSPWLAVHPANTTTKRIPDEEGGLVLTLGFWPSRVEDDLRARLRDVSVFKPPRPADAPSPTTAELQEQNRLDHAVLREAAKWSVRGWDATEPAAVVETVEVDGRKHSALSEESLEILYRNRLLLVAGIEAVAMNCLTESQKKTSGGS